MYHVASCHSESCFAVDLEFDNPSGTPPIHPPISFPFVSLFSLPLILLLVFLSAFLSASYSLSYSPSILAVRLSLLVLQFVLRFWHLVPAFSYWVFRLYCAQLLGTESARSCTRSEPEPGPSPYDAARLQLLVHCTSPRQYRLPGLALLPCHLPVQNQA